MKDQMIFEEDLVISNVVVIKQKAKKHKVKNINEMNEIILIEVNINVVGNKVQKSQNILEKNI